MQKKPDFQTCFKQVAEKCKESNFFFHIFLYENWLMDDRHVGDITKLKKKTCDVHPHQASRK